VLSQFEGYERLEEFAWQGYAKKYGDIHRLDRILEAEGDTVNRYKRIRCVERRCVSG
jgi:alpha,alpha-trehalase